MASSVKKIALSAILTITFVLFSPINISAAVIVDEGEACSPPAIKCDPAKPLVCTGGFCKRTGVNPLGPINPPGPIETFGSDISGAGKFLTNAFSLFLIIGVILTMFWLLWGGLSYITAGGDKQATQAAREKITTAVIGLILLFSVYIILTVLGTFLGFDIKELVVPQP